MMRRIRAIVILVVVIANVIMAIPRMKVKDEDLADPEWRKEDVDNWYRWTGGLGMEPEAFRGMVLSLWWGWSEAVGALRAPLKPVFDLTHTNQQWGLFAVVTEAPDRFVVEVRRDGEWETLYRRLDPEHDWRDDVLKYRRVRGVWDGVADEPKGTYKRLTKWIAREIFVEQPDVDRVRVVLEKEDLALPWDEVDPEKTRRAQRYHRRHEIMEPEPEPEPAEPDPTDQEPG